MRCCNLSLSFTSLLVLCLAVCTLPGSNACTTEMGCQSQTSARSVLEFANPAPLTTNMKALTNAQRLSQGLPLLPPTRRSNQLLPRAPRASPGPMVTYRGRIRVFRVDNNQDLGFITPDPNYWTPLLGTDAAAALQIEFSLPLGATSGNQLQLLQLNDGRGPIFGLVVGRDSTDSNIALGSFNYLYFDTVFSPGTSPGSTPQNVDSLFSTSTGLQKAAETSVWTVDLTSSSMSVQWINSDGGAPTTEIFVQSNRLYGGGDTVPFQSRFPAPVVEVKLTLDLVSQI